MRGTTEDELLEKIIVEGQFALRRARRLIELMRLLRWNESQFLPDSRVHEGNNDGFPKVHMPSSRRKR